VAGSSDDNGGGGMITGINVTPLVDVTLVLLIIFIVTAKLIVSPAVPLDLPKAARSDEVQVVFSVLLPKDGPTLVDGEPAVEDDVLLSRARLAVSGNAELRAVISADGAVPHARVIHTLDLLKRAGVIHVAFATSEAPEEQ
jgi:biopolymer transport protein ExbD